MKVMPGIAVIFTLLVGCGSHENKMSQSKSSMGASFIQWGASSVRGSTMADARKDSLKVCLKGNVSSANLERSKQWSTKATLTWLRVLKSIDTNVTNEIQYTCSGQDLTWNLISGSGTSNASPSYINVYMNRGFGTWTHELGHAFSGLGDTYSGRTAGNCRSGHPESLMCWGAYGPRSDHTKWSTLWQDDVDGITANYTRLFGTNLETPVWGEGYDHTQPLDMSEPWPEFSNQIIIAEDQMDVTIDETLHMEVEEGVFLEDL